ncbi:HNH endonuclease [Corynebacterium phocae]|nr:HNH endonuclease [Corynebacterium phocae]
MSQTKSGIPSVATSPPCQNGSLYLFDPYSASQIALRDRTQCVEIDHVFPLSASWDMGAWAWDERTRKAFANDPLNLVATGSSLNQDKSDQLPSQWMPPEKATRCWYVQRVAAVAAKYRLSLTTSDVKTMRRACRLVMGPPLSLG